MATEKKTILLKTRDGETFEVEETVAMMSDAIRHMIEDECASGVIPLPNVTANTFSKVLEYCKKHAEVASGEAEDRDKHKEEMDNWDAEFLKLDKRSLFDVVKAANYLSIRSLLNLGCEKIADMLGGKSTEQIRREFNVKNDFTPEEEEAVRRENQWAFD